MKLQIKDLRENHGLTQRQAADMLNIKYSTYSNYESGKREPNLETLEALSKFYNCTVDYLMGISESPHPPAITKDSPEAILEAKRELTDLIMASDIDLDVIHKLKKITAIVSK